jgi:hypothetical protein
MNPRRHDVRTRTAARRVLRCNNARRARVTGAESRSEYFLDDVAGVSISELHDRIFMRFHRCIARRIESVCEIWFNGRKSSAWWAT